MTKLLLDKEQLTKWAKNLLFFTAPILAVFFAQLALKVSLKDAALVALLALYGLLADYFKKLKK
jgi:hypothetical protein